ncbi:sperm-associated antigen 1 [Denticeps clupeoides]|uniref:sperm-associated antigen 1 n=1 Tax=Denticeps clupeoides TaxID=299321 RepID=UPI0010A30F81|nr:sperm-associated antigen 1-like [Denticeps clupeoides]
MNAEVAAKYLSDDVTVKNVHVEHLDYGFIDKCTDVKYLERIFTTLRSGQEGVYPHLQEFCKKRIEKLNPKSHALRQDKPPATAAALPEDEWNQISEEIKAWESEMKASELNLSQSPVSSGPENLPSVRGSSRPVHNSTGSSGGGDAKDGRKTAVPRDYREWDKFDIEKECGKIDEDDSPQRIRHGLPKIRRKIETTATTDQERLILANHERNKGNEAFRAKDYEEAAAYFTRSLSVVPTVAAFNNRAQAEIELQNWRGALSDCEQVLEMEPGNVKALLRRATALQRLGHLEMAAEDARTVLSAESRNVTAKKLLEEVSKKMTADAAKTLKKGKKILIEVVGEEEEMESGE